MFKSGKEYVTVSNMRNYHAWGTEVEILAFAQIAGFHVVVYTSQGAWIRYSRSDIEKEPSERRFYLSNQFFYTLDK